MKTPLQMFLTDNPQDGLKKLHEEKGIKIYRHPTLPLVGFAYDQIDSPKTDLVVRWSRGTVLEEGTWDLVAQSMPRFFNMGENAEEWKGFDWTNFTATEKMDGSLLIVYFYKDSLMVNTSGSFGGPVSNHDVTFMELFLSQVKEADLRKDITYVFELCSPFNKVVRNYDQTSARLITAFRKMQELSRDELEGLTNDTIKPIPLIVDLKTQEDVLNYLMHKEESDPTYEGIVIRDSKGTRFKCKTKTYLGFHHMNDKGKIGSYKRILPFVLAGECSEVKAYFPELAGKIDEATAKVAKAFNDLNLLWESSKMITDQKAFAQAVQHNPFKGILFVMKKQGKTDLKDAWRKSDELILKNLFGE